MHTPGPWTAEGERIHGKAPTGAQLGLHLATAHEIDGTRTTLDANARLIASAPLLLEALQRIGGLLNHPQTLDLRIVERIVRGAIHEAGEE